jgi:hypothetical protein
MRLQVHCSGYCLGTHYCSSNSIFCGSNDVLTRTPSGANPALLKCHRRITVSIWLVFFETINADRSFDSFPPPRIFTNALLGPHDITALIRDTEAHERALFQTDPSAKSQRRATRRGTMFQPEADGESMASRIYAARNNRNQSAVARVLGSDMMDEIKRSAGTSARGTRSEVNIDVLLRGAEILCNV